MNILGEPTLEMYLKLAPNTFFELPDFLYDTSDEEEGRTTWIKDAFTEQAVEDESEEDPMQIDFTNPLYQCLK